MIMSGSIYIGRSSARLGMGEVKNEYSILMGKHVGSLRRWDNNFKMDLSVIVKLGVK